MSPQQASYLPTPHHLRSSGEYRVWSAPTICMHVFNNPSFVTHDAQRLSYRVRVSDTRGEHGASLHRVPDPHATLRFHENCWLHQQILTILPLCLLYVFCSPLTLLNGFFFVSLYILSYISLYCHLVVCACRYNHVSCKWCLIKFLHMQFPVVLLFMYNSLNFCHKGYTVRSFFTTS